MRAVITEIDFERKRVSLSIRQLLEAEAEQAVAAEREAEDEPADDDDDPEVINVVSADPAE